jgi:hypothetical protein
MAGQYTVTTLEAIRAAGMSFAPGRWIGFVDRGEGDHFSEQIWDYHSEFMRLTVESRQLEAGIAEHIARLLEQRE